MSIPRSPEFDNRFDPYATLGVAGSAEFEEIRAAYHAAARRYHPDATAGSGSDRPMVEVNAAWAILRDPVQRASWDSAHRPVATVPQTSGRPGVTACVWRRGPNGEGAAGPPPDHPSGSVLPFGLYLCWSIGEIAKADLGYLQWLAARPDGRPYRAEIEAVLAARPRGVGPTSSPTQSPRRSSWRRLGR